MTLSAEKFSADTGKLLTEVRAQSGDPQAEILALREKTDESGQTVYEIDIR